MKKTFLIFIGAAYHGQLFHTIQAKNSVQAHELLTAYLTANKFEGVEYDKELQTVFCFGWHIGSCVTKGKFVEGQNFGSIHFNIEPAEDWAI